MLPSVCRFAKAGDDPCGIGFDHYRERKTGPGFPVAVLECRTHDRCFTLYPLGHHPYGRAAVAPVSPDGEPLFSAGGGDDRRLAWETTLFAPAFALVAGEKPVPTKLEAWWATEPADCVPFAAAVLGLDLPGDERIGEAVAEAIGIATLELRQAGRDYLAARGPVARAGVVVAVLRRIPSDRRLVDRLVASGALTGTWGGVQRWDPGQGGPRRRLFPGRGIPDG